MPGYALTRIKAPFPEKFQRCPLAVHYLMLTKAPQTAASPAPTST
jgi:hypothetical protein